MGFHFNPNMFNTIRWSVWGQQIWALVGAVAALTTMAILLGKFNNRPVFNQMGITLNAIISILSVTIKAAVACILSECLAQWKWILYGREDRVLIDFDRLDGAARGPLGSLRVLLRTKRAYVLNAIVNLPLLANLTHQARCPVRRCFDACCRRPSSIRPATPSTSRGCHIPEIDE